MGPAHLDQLDVWRKNLRYCRLMVWHNKFPKMIAYYTKESRSQLLLLLCRFLDAGMTTPSTRCGGPRPKSAKARSRGRLGTGGAAGAMGGLWRRPGGGGR